jgi:hypothetical protein
MPTRTYAQLLSLIQALCGVTFATIELGRIKALLNRRAFTAYRASNFWPRFLTVGEERSLFGNVLTSVVTGDRYIINYIDGEVDFTEIGAESNAVGVVFISTATGDLGGSTVKDYLGYIPYVESGKNDIDTFVRIHKDRPYQSRSAQEFDFYVSGLGATLISGTLNPSSVFVTYKKTNSAQYGDSAGETTEIPLEWFQYLAHATYADYLRAEGQQEKAQLADQEAELILNEELMRIDNQRTSGTVGTRFSTNANYQLR